jgi:hypothetical protein
MRTKNAAGVFERVPMETRFWEKVAKGGPDGCWLWTGAVRNGYGYITDYWNKFYVHRYAFELAYAPIPPGRWIHVCHSCDVKLCVNPRHLWLGTARANQDEAIKRERTGRGEKNAAAKLTEAQVREIRKLYSWGVVTQADLSRNYGVTQVTISRVINRQTWRHVD